MKHKHTRKNCQTLLPQIISLTALNFKLIPKQQILDESKWTELTDYNYKSDNDDGKFLNLLMIP